MDNNVIMSIIIIVGFIIASVLIIFVLLKMRYDKALCLVDDYMDEIAQYMGESWQEVEKQNPPEKKNYVSTVRFLVQRSGKVTKIEIVEPSGWEEMDKSIIEVINQKSPVDRIPEGYPYPTVEIEMSFHYS